MLSSLKDELSPEKLKGVKLWITVGPREKFTASEVLGIKKFYSLLWNCAIFKKINKILNTWLQFYSLVFPAHFTVSVPLLSFSWRCLKTTWMAEEM